MVSLTEALKITQRTFYISPYLSFGHYGKDVEEGDKLKAQQGQEYEYDK